MSIYKNFSKYINIKIKILFNILYFENKDKRLNIFQY